MFGHTTSKLLFIDRIIYVPLSASFQSSTSKTSDKAGRLVIFGSKPARDLSVVIVAYAAFKSC